MSRFGGIYRLPPTPQRSRPSAILPSEVFPNPPVASRRHALIMAVVASSWAPVQPPQPSHPVATDGAAVVEHIPRTESQHQSIVVEAWNQLQVSMPQRRHPSAILPTEVFDNPPIETRHHAASVEVVFNSWLPDPDPQQRFRNATLPAEVFDKPPLGTRARQYTDVVVSSWQKDPQAQQRRPTATEGEVVAPFIAYTRDNVATTLWLPTPLPHQRIRNATLPAQVFDDPPLGDLRCQINRALVENWHVLPIPQRQIPVVTAGVLVVIPDICGPLFSALQDAGRISTLIDAERKSALLDPRRISDLECD